MGKSWRDVREGARYLNQESIGNKTISDTIDSTKEGEYKGRKQVVAHLKKLDILVVINVTSCKLWGEKYGDDIDDWVGKKCSIYISKEKPGAGMNRATIVEP